MSKNLSYQELLHQYKVLDQKIATITASLKKISSKNFSMQSYIGETVLYELLCQSYGFPEYSTEERLKRIISCISNAMKQYDKQRYTEETDVREVFQFIEPNISEINLKSLKRTFVAKRNTKHCRTNNQKNRIRRKT